MCYLFQSKLVYEGHIYDGVAVLSDLPYDEFDVALTWMQSFVEVVGHNYRSDAADEVRLLFGYFLSQENNHSTVISMHLMAKKQSHFICSI